MTIEAALLPVTHFADTEEGRVTFPPLGPEPRVLLVWPGFPPSYWGMSWTYELVPERAVVPPLALVTLAALFPAGWRPRLIDRVFQDLSDEDVLAADLVMVSAMNTQRDDTLDILDRCRRLGRRTVIGGPYASAEPEVFLSRADHVVIGEVDESFAEIAAELESGCARRVYRVIQKPDVTKTPVPRFELLDLDKYTMMAIQFARGCPFQCEFCDIITLYGRRPRTKSPAQVIAEVERLYQLGWRSWVLIVDDNFIGNHHKALEMSRELAGWQKSRGYPFAFFTELSIDLAQRDELMTAMVEANFIAVFIGIETTSPAALKETKKFQNLRADTLTQVRTIQSRGLWVSAGLIVGFDSDDETIFEQQRQFIDRAALAWAFINMLQAPPTTPLHERLRNEGRLFERDLTYSGTCSAPNFQTVIPRDVLLDKTAALVRDVYEPGRFLRLSLTATDRWTPQAAQRLPSISFRYQLRALIGSIWVQGMRSHYRGAYWRYVAGAVRRWWRDPIKLKGAFCSLLIGHHFINYARHLANELDRERLVSPRTRPAPEQCAPLLGIQASR